MVAIGAHRVFGTTVCSLFLSLARELRLCGVASMRDEFISVNCPLATFLGSSHDVIA